MTLPQKVHLRNQLIRKLWVVLRDISDEVQELADEDMDVWDAVTKHSTVQKRLEPAPERKK